MQQTYPSVYYVTVFMYGKGIILHSGEKGLLVILTGGTQLEFWQTSYFLVETGIPQSLQPEHHFRTASILCFLF
jgi:hypothetical protein